jgi:hypothetical protein
MSRLLAIDFDGTIVAHAFPAIGEPLPLAFAVMQELQAAGHRLVLNTCREGDYLAAAVLFCQRHGITFRSVNQNHPEDEFRPEPGRKVYAHVYIDDRNLGGFPGWAEVRRQLLEAA